MSEKVPAGRVIRSGLRKLLSTVAGETLAWKQVHRAGHKLEGLTNGTIEFTKTDKHGWILVLRDELYLDRLSTVVSERLVSVFYDQLTSHNLQLSIVFDHQITQHLSDVYCDSLGTAMESGHCTLWSIKEMPPFSLAVIDREELWLGVYNECGQLQGIIRTEAAAAVEWAEQRLEHYTEQAMPIGQQEIGVTSD